MDRALDRIGLNDRPGLIGEQIDRVRGMVPQQMIGPDCAPRPWRSCSCGGRNRSGRPSAGWRVRPPTILLWMYWWLGLKRRVCPTMQVSPVSCCLASTASPSARLSAQRDLDLHMLARVHALDRLRGVHLRRRAQDHRVEPRLRPALRPARCVAWRDAVFRRRPPAVGSSRRPTTEIDLDAVDQLQRRRDAFHRRRRRRRGRFSCCPSDCHLSEAGLVRSSPSPDPSFRGVRPDSQAETGSSTMADRGVAARDVIMAVQQRAWPCPARRA